MNLSEQSRTREILRKHIDAALATITSSDLYTNPLAEDTDSRLAEIALQVLLSMQEAASVSTAGPQQ